jgi:adenosylcobinamide-GDP ribazoletransferase
VLAVQFLTRLPVPSTAQLTPEQVAIGLVRAVAWFPLVGALVGAITAGVAIAAMTLWPTVIAVLLALIVEVRLTGAFHEDAIADFCDAFGGGITSEDLRHIMKDSRIGSFGAVGLTFGIGLRAALTWVVLESLPLALAAMAIIAAATFGRLVAVILMTLIAPAASHGSLAKDVGSRADVRTLLLALLASLPGVLGFALFEPNSLLAAIGVTVLFLLWFRNLLMRGIGGSTGDCLGFAAFAGQLILLLAATAH